MIDGTEITQVSSVKFLGVLVDEKLNWKEHIHNVTNKMSKSVGVISKITEYINRKCLLALYHSLVYPHITYCNIVWGSTYESNLNCIHLIQKRFVRIATRSDRREHSQPLFKELKLLNIYQINILQICIFIFKFEHLPHELPLSFRNYFLKKSQLHGRNTRQTFFHPPLYRTSQGQFSIKYRGVDIWKKYSLTSHKSLLTYKKTLKQNLLEEN